MVGGAGLGVGGRGGETQSTTDPSLRARIRQHRCPHLAGLCQNQSGTTSYSRLPSYTQPCWLACPYSVNLVQAAPHLASLCQNVWHNLVQQADELEEGVVGHVALGKHALAGVAGVCLAQHGVAKARHNLQCQGYGGRVVGGKRSVSLNQSGQAAGSYRLPPGPPGHSHSHSCREGLPA